MSKPISPETLHQGAFFALEQAGHLLHDAVLLADKERWPTALVLAVMSIEEIGKLQILLDHLGKALRSEVVDADSLKATFKKHHEKLKHGLSEDSYIASVGGWGELPQPGTLDRHTRSEGVLR